MKFNDREIQPGDELTVRAKVKDAEIYVVRVSFGSSLKTEAFSEDEIATHTPAPRPIKVGDRMKEKWSSKVGVVEGVHGNFVWLSLPDAEYPYTYNADRLELAPDTAT